jgi:hypothetical protein
MAVVNARRKTGAKPDEPLRFADGERERLKRRHRELYCDGARCAFLMTFPGPRTADGFPVDFHHWREAWRRAWLAGFDIGFAERFRVVAEMERGHAR